MQCAITTDIAAWTPSRPTRFMRSPLTATTRSCATTGLFASCAYHRWGLFESPARGLATFILGGGVPKNYNLQPEPALGQVLGLPNVRGYQFDVQITTAPVTDGSLSSCLPAEAVTWGKVNNDTYMQTNDSLHADYTAVIPFLVPAFLDNR